MFSNFLRQGSVKRRPQGSEWENSLRGIFSSGFRDSWKNHPGVPKELMGYHTIAKIRIATMGNQPRNQGKTPMQYQNVRRIW